MFATSDISLEVKFSPISLQCFSFPLGCLILCSFAIVRYPLSNGFPLLKISRTFGRSIWTIPFPITIRLISDHLTFRPNGCPIRMVFDRVPVDHFQFLFFNAIRLNQVTFFMFHFLFSSLVVLGQRLISSPIWELSSFP